MSTVESIQRVAPKRRTRPTGALMALGVLVALAVAALFIFALSGKTTTPARPAAASHTHYVPLIQYRGTGQAPTAPTTHLAPAAPPTVGLLRAEHSYGAVP